MNEMEKSQSRELDNKKRICNRFNPLNQRIGIESSRLKLPAVGSQLASEE